MQFPIATYRLQFRNGMTFDRARNLVPYLKKLGISHLYASPVFTATSGSTHGYDVTDANEIDPGLGGREAFDRLANALKDAGLGLILDIVPNHMAASLENPWWRDVIEQGQDSRYAHHFDIDWSRRLTLPFLGDDFGAVLAAGDIAVAPHPETGKPAFAYFDSYYPLHPSTYAGREAEILGMKNRNDLSQLHDRQPYRLMSWRDAARDLSYRRFFEVTGLAGLRVEDDTVFNDSHRLILELVRNGSVQGLRIDHVDGLADPKRYLDRLRQGTGPDCYIVVEKILGEGERLPPDWPVSGTTGYEFIAALSHALVDDRTLGQLSTAYDSLSEEAPSAPDQLRAAKLLMVTRNFEGEVSRLLNIGGKIAAETQRQITEEQLKTAFSEMLVFFPVYRTYGTRDGLRPDDRKLVDAVVSDIAISKRSASPEALAFLADILTGNLPSSLLKDAAIFRTKFQQLTGPIMAKSVEDTLFFRNNVLLGLNEVGAEPLCPKFSLERFHCEMRLRKERQPFGLSGSSTHDTKRGEDARARLYALSEAPELWAKAVKRWRDMNAHNVQRLADGLAPEPDVEWMLYQALAGVMPLDFDRHYLKSVAELKDRFLAYVEKALREAKLRTDWGDPNEPYEQAVKAYASHLISGDANDFLTDFAATIQPLVEAGLANSVTQTIIKLLAPGIPDIYQGSEGFDFSLVDPDNRREPDFELLSENLARVTDVNAGETVAWRSGLLKQHLIARLLELRRSAPDLFNEGDYVPLQETTPETKHIIAFARTLGDRSVLVALPRFTLAETPDHTFPPALADVSVRLPPELQQKGYRDLWTGEEMEIGESLRLDRMAKATPFLILHRPSSNI